ncbi:MAG TPA: hypothetical protein VFW40_07465, partial [Capsulimonadaceae bacterium]|nr:hypothetical protein [Capsulimonadaceae bacterium]
MPGKVLLTLLEISLYALIFTILVIPFLISIGVLVKWYPVASLYFGNTPTSGRIYLAKLPRLHQSAGELPCP